MTSFSKFIDRLNYSENIYIEKLNNSVTKYRQMTSFSKLLDRLNDSTNMYGHIKRISKQI